MAFAPQPAFPASFALGGQVELCAAVPADASAVFAVVDANRKRLRRWLPWVDFSHDVSATRAFLDGAVERRSLGTAAAYVVWSGSGVAGLVDLHDVKADQASFLIGYWIAAEFEGQGLVMRACSALLDWAFTTGAMERGVIQSAIGNARSAAIPRRLGFTLEGVARHAQILSGAFVDLEVYSLLRAEWLARRGQEPGATRAEGQFT